MQCSVYLFGRIGIVSSDSKSSHPIQHSKPHRVPLGGDPDRFVQPHVIGVSAGPYHAAVVTATGDVYTWGSGFAGQLASGRRDNAVWPQVVKASVYSRSLYSLRVDQVACGGAHTLMRFDDGTVASCGCDKDGQLGQGTVYECSVPLAVAGLASRKIRQIACGGMHTLLLDEAGKVLAFGSGANGRLGLGNTATIAKPAEITALAPVTTKSISCGWSSSMCIASSTAPGRSSVGLVYTWGHGECGRLGHGVDQDGRGLDQDVWSPRVVDELRRCGCHITQCSMGHQHAAVRTGTGDVWVWGSGARGQLGLGMLSARGTSLPSKMPLPPTSAGSVIKVLCGAAHTVILTSFGKVFVCGAANAGQLGLGSLQSDVPSPTLVSLRAFACDVGAGWECTIVVTHTREKSDDTGAFSTSSGSRLRGASDCSDSDLGGVDAPSPSASELSGSIVMEGPVTGAPLPAVAECPMAACITGSRMGGDGRTRYFAFRCSFGDLSPWTSYKRYSECLRLSDAIKGDPRAPSFPAKSWGLSRLLADEEELSALEEQRQQALQSWFDHYLEQGSSFVDYGKFLLFFEVGRQQKLQGGEGGLDARDGVAPDVTMHEGATRTDATFASHVNSGGCDAAAADDSKDKTVSSHQQHVDRDRSGSSVSVEGRGSNRGSSMMGERDAAEAGAFDSDDFTFEGGGSVMATPQKQRLCEEEDPDIANLLQTPDSFDKGLGADFETIPGSINLFQGDGGGDVMRRSPGGSGINALDDLDRFNSISSVTTNSSQAFPRSQTPPHVRAMGSRVPVQLDVSAFIAPRVISTSLFCGWSSLWGKGEDSKGSRTPSPQNTGGGARRNGADALLSLWGSSNRWLEILEPHWKVTSQKSQVRSFWRRGIPPHVRGKVWKKAIGNKLSIEKDLYEYNRNQALAIFRPDTTASASIVAAQTFSGSGSFRSPSPWIVQDDRSSSAQQFATRGGVDFPAREQGRGMRRVSSSGLLLLAEDGGNFNCNDQATWFDWTMTGGAAGVFAPLQLVQLALLSDSLLHVAGAGSDAYGARMSASIPEMVRNVPQDVLRTMQHLQLFQEDCPYQRDLRDLLGAFAFMRQNVGYVQSMSYIAAMFLLYSSGLFFANAATHSSGSYSDSPFDAFVSFSNVIIRPFFQNYFKRREEHLLQRHHAFEVIFKANLPDLHCRFEVLEIGVHLYLEGWFTCMFAKCLEPRLVSRVWDLYLCDGAIAAYKIAIALLHLRGAGVSACPIEEVVKRLTGMASHDESDLFELYKQVELPTGLRALIEELEGESNDAE